MVEHLTINWRDLCAELLGALENEGHAHWPGGPDGDPLIEQARAALAEPVADGPAVPESREPASVVGEPSDEELLGIAAQAIEPYDKISLGEYEAENNCAIEVYTSELIAFARAVLARYGHQPAPPDEGVDRSHISDGYHTFAELYDHRHSLMLALMRAIPKLCWFSQQHADGEMPFGTTEWFIAGVDLPTGAITYHLPSELLSLAQQTGAAELSVGRPWDGHTANDVIERLRAWVASPQPALSAEGEVGELVAWLRDRAESTSLAHNALRITRAADLLERQAAPVPQGEGEK